MIQELTITKVYKSEKDKQGNPLKTKDKGIPYTRVAIQVDYAEYEGKWLSKNVFREDDPVLNLEKDKRYLLKIEPNGEWLNFDLPRKTDLLESRIQRLERWVEQINEKLMGAKAEGRMTINKEELPPAPEDSDIPF